MHIPATFSLSLHLFIQFSSLHAVISSCMFDTKTHYTNNTKAQAWDEDSHAKYDQVRASHTLEGKYALDPKRDLFTRSARRRPHDLLNTCMCHHHKKNVGM
jgi:hypothetical protein